MIDCSQDLTAYHNAEVTLATPQQTAMRGRRDANRKRVKDGLKKSDKPAVKEFCTQGSYAMKTMVQDPDDHYDIDDGIYFEKSDLKGDRGGEMTALDVRQMVRDAVDDGSFKTKPEVLTNCVRVHYDGGYHVDLPAYRHIVDGGVFRNEEYNELASSAWKRSDARDVTDWFKTQNKNQSPDEENGRQLRRICRFIKKFSQSRPSWQDCIGSGFMITKLVTERFAKNIDREDESLYNTMKGIRDRLEIDLVVHHPVTPNDTISKGADDPKAKFLRDRLSDAIRWLEPTTKTDCTREKALECWDKVFNTDFFSNQNGGGGGRASSATFIKESSRGGSVKKEGGGTYA
jgi:hypothetical protein